MPEITDPNALAELNGGSAAPSTKGSVRTIFTAPASPKDAAAEGRAQRGEQRDIAKEARDAQRDTNTQNNQQFDNESTMRKEYRARKAVADFETILPQVATSMKLAQKKDATGADDLNIIYAFGKVMDPGSVVREGELALASGTGSWAQNLEAAIAKIQSGEKMPPEVRRNLVESMRRRGIELAKAYQQERDYYSDMAKRKGFLPEDIVGPHAALPYQQAEADFAHIPVYTKGEVAALPGGEQGGGGEKTNFTTGGGFVPTDDQNKAAAEFLKTNPSPEQFVAFSNALLGPSGGAISPEDAKRTIDGIRKGAAWGGYNPSVKESDGLVDTALEKTGAAAVGATNAISGGWLPEAVGAVAGDDVQRKMEENVSAIRNENPGSFFTGELAGTIAGAEAMGAAGAKALSTVAPKVTPAILQGGGKVALAREVAKDASFGAATGAGNAEEGERLEGAGKGAVLALGGNLAGKAAAKVASKALSPTVDEGVRLLRDKGVRTSIGQSIGPEASRIEESLASLPIVGASIRASRRRALSDFNQAVVNNSLELIGRKLPKEAVGSKAMDYAQTAFNTAYADARKGLQLVPDAQLVTDLNVMAQRAANGEFSSETVTRLQKIYDAQIGRRIKKGALSGDDYKEMMSRLGKLRDGAKRQDNIELADGIADMEAIVDNAARRSSPAEAVKKLDDVDTGYALFVRAENAAKMRGGDTGMFTPSQYDAAVQRGDSSVRSKAYLRGDALGQDMAEAGKNVLRDKVGDSGSFERAAVGYGLQGGAAAWNPLTLAPAATVMAAYAPKVRDATSSLIAGKRPQQVEKWAQFINERSRLASAPAASVLLNYGVGSN